MWFAGSTFEVDGDIATRPDMANPRTGTSYEAWALWPVTLHKPRDAFIPLGMRTSHALGLGAVLCQLGAGCYRGHGAEDSSAHATRSDRDKFGSAGAAAQSGTLSELRVLTARAITAFDRQIKAACECLVAAGTYESEQLCFEMLGSGPTWNECGAKVLAEHDTPEAREQIDCFIARTEQQAVCVENAACHNDALSQCATVPAQCAQTIVPELLERCPDLGLLSRLK